MKKIIQAGLMLSFILVPSFVGAQYYTGLYQNQYSNSYYPYNYNQYPPYQQYQPGCNFTVNLSLGMSHSQIADLNRMLGVGSGIYFDNATYNAVVNFQNQYSGEILYPVGLTYATGYVGAMTRAKLNSLCNGITVPMISYNTYPYPNVYANTYNTYGYSGSVLGASTYPYLYQYPYNYNSASPTLNFYSSNINQFVNAGDSVVLSWNSTNVNSCNASNGWSGSKNSNGTESRQVSYNSNFTLTCYGNNGEQIVRTIFVNTNGVSGATGNIAINFYANPANVYVGGSTTLYWTATNASTCTASSNVSSNNGWTGSRGISGNEMVSGLTSTRTYTLTCSNSSGQSTTQSATVGVLSS
ncbi:MAG TPA: hypothetical protein VJK09_00060 [Candidatus Paceibacterota bacterium]